MPLLTKIVIEEAFALPETVAEVSKYSSPYGTSELAVDLVDIHGRRLQRMDDCGIRFMVLSLTSPGPQGEHDPIKAEALAMRSNDYLALNIKRNPTRFGGFASVSMHSAEVASREAVRAIKELGLLGIIVNDFQTMSEDGNDIKFYDQPEYDLFWRTIEELDVPVYIHPRITTPDLYTTLLAERRWLWASAYFFSVGVSLHVLGLYCHGVFDRFPNLRIVIGHMGEHLPGQIWRIDQRLAYQSATNPIHANRSLRETMGTNIFITTSGHFSDDAVKYAASVFGVDRILFSIDYPYDRMEHGASWIDGMDGMTEAEKTQIAHRNAVKLLKLDFLDL